VSRKIVVTGGSGFIGRSLVRRLIDAGDDVTVWTRKNKNLKPEEITVDCSDPVAVETALDDLKPSLVIHLSGQPDPQISWDAPVETIESNLVSTLNFLNLQNRLYKFRLVVTSSSSVAPFKRADVDLAKTTPYAFAKYGAETLVQMFGMRFGTDSVLVRPFAIIGPGKENDALSDFCKQACEIESGRRDFIRPIGALDSLRDFVDVEDCVTAIGLAAKHANPGQCFDIGRGRGVAVGEIIRYLDEYSETSIRVCPTCNLTLRPGEASSLVGDPAALLELGWVPSVSLEQTVRNTFDFWREVYA